MAQVAVNVNGHNYMVACDDGEEPHLRELARYVDKHLSDLANSLGQVGDARLILMAALLIADELTAALNETTALKEDMGKLKGTRSIVMGKAQEAEDVAAKLLEAAAGRIEAIAERLEAS